MKRLPFLLILLLLGMVRLPAAGQGAAWPQARRALQQGPGPTFEHNGYRMAGEPITGSLARGDSVELPVDLRGGTQYKVVGVCDASCGDLNLTLFDPAGAQVDVDDIPEENCPIVTAVPSQAGRFRLRVSMPA